MTQRKKNFPCSSEIILSDTIKHIFKRCFYEVVKSLSSLVYGTVALAFFLLTEQPGVTLESHGPLKQANVLDSILQSHKKM